MFKRIRSKIGIKLLIAFSLALILSMVSLIYVATQLVAEFGEFSASKNEANIKDNTYALLARITHEQTMRYDSTFQKIAAASSLIAKQASHVHAHRESYGEEPLTPSEKLVVSPKNGIFSNGPSGKTMVLYWGSSTISPAIDRQIKALSKLDILLENSKESNAESVACYFVSESAIARYYPNIKGVNEIPSGFDIRKANWYVKSRLENNPERKTVWSNVYLDIVGQGLMTTAGSPVYSGTGQYLGAVGIDVTLDSIVNDILSDIKSPHRMKGMFSFLIDSTGKIIAFPPEYLKMFDLKIETGKLADSSVILEKSLLESSNAEVRRIGKKMIEIPFQVGEFSLNGHPYVLSSHFMPSTGWRLGMVVPESVIFSSIQETRNALDSTVERMTTRFTIVALSFLLGTIIIMVLFTVKNIIRPINNLSKAALRVREGDLTTQIDLHGEDELGALAYSFNDMIKALRKSKELEEGYTRKLEQKVDDRTLELSKKNDESKNTLRLLKREMAERKEAEEELQKSEARYRNVFDSAGTATVLIEEDMTISIANPEFEKLSGYSREEIEGRKKWTEFGDTEDLKRMKEYHAIRRSKEGEVPTEYEFRFIDKQGNVKNIFLKTGMIPGTKRSVASLMDITERKQAEAVLRESEELLTSYLENAPEGIYMNGLEGTFLYGNRMCEEIIGYRREELIGKNLLELNLLSENSFDKAVQLLQANMEGKPTGPDEIELISKEGRLIPVEINTSVVQRMGQKIVLAFIRDITERKQAEEKIQQMAYHDSLTGLPNRKLFSDRSSIALTQAQRNKKEVGIAMLDLDNFKDVNDTLGHDVGDLLLKATAERLTAALRKGDTVARFGGDEFALILPDLKAVEDAIQVAQKIVDSFRKPFLIDTHQLMVTTSIGIAVYPDDGVDESTLLKNADIAMYQAKQAGRDRYHLYKQ